MHSRTKPNTPNPLNESGSRPVTRPLMRRAIRGPQGGALRPHHVSFYNCHESSLASNSSISTYVAVAGRLVLAAISICPPKSQPIHHIRTAGTA